MKRLLPLLAFVAVLFTSCPDPRETVNFDTDPRVLRGSWNFVVSDSSNGAVVSTQAVVFTPTFVSDRWYTVAASLTLEGEVYALAGEIYGWDQKFVRPQYQPMPGASLTLTGLTTGKKYTAFIEGQLQYLRRWRFFGGLQTTGKYFQLEIVRN